ncbi:MAG: hypothetical protein H0X29_02315 [Parachlamydiaceae bacterium]|nr:hypothetical protein [Parachlamydiaceae bacterium]
MVATMNCNFTVSQAPPADLERARFFMKAILSIHPKRFSELQACNSKCQGACQNVFVGNCQRVFNQNAKNTYELIATHLKNHFFKKSKSYVLEDQVHNIMFCEGQKTQKFLKVLDLIDSLRSSTLPPSPQANLTRAKKARKERDENILPNNSNPAQKTRIFHRFTFSPDDIAKSANNELRKSVPQVHNVDLNSSSIEIFED